MIAKGNPDRSLATGKDAVQSLLFPLLTYPHRFS
jgi:hypothetical protein